MVLLFHVILFFISIILCFYLLNQNVLNSRIFYLYQMESISATTAKIYYFTGTGNALKVVVWIKDALQKNGWTVDVLNIAERSQTQMSETETGLIGICAPTHGFNFPPIVLKFLLKFPRARRQSVFIINTRAGMKMGKRYLPGLSGVAQLFAALVLSLKGYRIVGMRPIDMPSNWISFHPGIKENVAKMIMVRCKSISLKFGERIALGKKDFRALYDLIQDLLIAPISFGYYLVGRFILAKSFYANSHCTLCNKCIKECPVKAIKKVDDRPYWTHRCESCMHCMNTCPVDSIQTAHGMVIGTLYIASAVVLRFGWKLAIKFVNSEFVHSVYDIGLLKFCIESVVSIFFLILAYRIMHFMMKFKFFEQFISYTSFTTYRFWRRFKNIKLQNI